MDETQKYYFDNAVPLTESDEEEVIDLSGYQVTKAEFFAHTREPSVTFWQNRVRFNMACLRRFPGVKYIQIMINPEEKKIIIRPCEPDTPDSLRWANGGGDKEIRNRDLMCKVFAARVFDLMEWDVQYRYKVLGKPATCDGEFLFLFKLCDFELFLSGRKKGSYLPVDWRNYFGAPADKHEEEYRINIADGYISTDKM